MTFRTFLLVVFCVVAVFALMAFAPPKPRVSGTTATFTIAPDSSVRAQARVTITGQMRAGDQIRYKFRKDGVVLVNMVEPSLTSSVVELPAPAYGATGVYDACARVAYANGTQGAERCSAGWTYTRPDLPLPDVESVEILPTSATLQPGQTQQFCAVIHWSDGSKTLADNQADIPYCQQFVA